MPCHKKISDMKESPTTNYRIQVVACLRRLGKLAPTARHFNRAPDKRRLLDEWPKGKLQHPFETKCEAPTKLSALMYADGISKKCTKYLRTTASVGTPSG